MPLSHAVAWISHHEAKVLQFSASVVFGESIREHVHYTRQHGSNVRSEHEFFAEACDALVGIKSVWVAGSHMAQADFRRYVDKHRPEMVRQIVGWETVNQPSEGQLIQMARKFFSDRGELPATPRLS